MNDPAEKAVLFHVGLPKAASTYLQRHLFPAIADATFLSLTSANLDHLPKVRSSSRAFLADPTAARAAIRQAERPKVIVSAEGFVGDPYRSFDDHEQRARDLYAVWPPAAVLLVIRRQDRFCDSLFGQALRKGYPYAPERFLWLNEPRPNALPEARHFDYRAADYDRIVGTYEALFGRERVFVIPLELLVDDPRAFHESVRGLGSYDLPDLAPVASENPAYTQRGYKAARLLNRLCLDERDHGIRLLAWLDRKAASGRPHWRWLRRAVRLNVRAIRRLVRRSVDALSSSGKERARPLQDANLAQVRSHFAASNRRLSERRGLGLERYGYF